MKANRFAANMAGNVFMALIPTVAYQPMLLSMDQSKQGKNTAAFLPIRGRNGVLKKTPVSDS